MLLLQHTKLNFLLFSLPPCWLSPAGENMSKSCGIFCFPNPQSHSKYPESQQSQILDGPKPLLPTQRYKAENTESSNVQLRDLSIHKRFPPARANKQDQSSHWEGQQSMVAPLTRPPAQKIHFNLVSAWAHRAQPPQKHWHPELGN